VKKSVKVIKKAKKLEKVVVNVMILKEILTIFTEIYKNIWCSWHYLRQTT